MTSEIVALVRGQVASSARRAVAPAAFAVIGVLFVLFAVAGLFVALFFWLAPERGPIVAALICAAVALVLALVALVPLLFKRRKPPPPRSADMTPQIIALMAKSASNLTPRQVIVAAALVGAALALTARGGGKT